MDCEEYDPDEGNKIHPGDRIISAGDDSIDTPTESSDTSE